MDLVLGSRLMGHMYHVCCWCTMRLPSEGAWCRLQQFPSLYSSFALQQPWIDLITNNTPDNPKILTSSGLPRIHGTQKRRDGEMLWTDNRECLKTNHRSKFSNRLSKIGFQTHYTDLQNETCKYIHTDGAVCLSLTRFVEEYSALYEGLMKVRQLCTPLEHFSPSWSHLSHSVYTERTIAAWALNI